ncbi:hypothetical protein AG1IA_09950 [Rhizoctonia solani AG-1 IA]|uniref:Transmembrane protein n=1 Tax=Thanatephorus cucumeris (strain AG1-IA) TaxID=983506 RepID=L8WDI2_THACA|nr:hypothetical protein AG1IA_09950 [Rhizoctonia solani AG-1 IA]
MSNEGYPTCRGPNTLLVSSTSNEDGASSIHELGSKSEDVIRRVKVEEGFRALGIASTFIAGVQSQCLGLVSNIPDHPKYSEVASALLIIGLLLSTFGAALSLLSARWFNLLKGDQIRLLEYRWECARKKDRYDIETQSDVQTVANQPKCNGHYGSKRDYIVAKVVGLSVPVVFR